MTYTVIIAVAVIMFVILLFTKPNFFTALITSGAWALFWWYFRTNPLATIPYNSFGGTIIMLCLGVMTFAPLLITFMRFNGENNVKRNAHIKELQKENRGHYYNRNGKEKSLGELTSEEYRDYVKNMMPRRK